MCINIERGSKKTLWNYNWHLSARNWRSPHRNCFMNEVTDVRKDLLVISIPMMSWSILERWPQSLTWGSTYIQVVLLSKCFQLVCFCPGSASVPNWPRFKSSTTVSGWRLQSLLIYISCNQGDYFVFFFTNFCWLSEAFNFLMIILAFPFHAFTPFKIK